jgi:predicted RNA binding protein YcfA (HicA-like mRNA interferase family)
MPRGLYNWTFQDVNKFLKEQGFSFMYINGSHHFYTCIVEGIKRQVCVPRHDNKSLHPSVLKSIISQSGIDKNKWINK